MLLSLLFKVFKVFSTVIVLILVLFSKNIKNRLIWQVWYRLFVRCFQLFL